jgi:hypothetical protein
VRAELRALASQQHAHRGRFVGYVVIYGAPPWATASPHGCISPGAGPTALALSEEGLTAYRGMVASLILLTRAEGADLRYWSAWNEPNQPAFISPQREHCSVESPSVAPGEYARVVRALGSALDAAPGDQRLVVGETAAYDTPRPTATATVEFVRGLPRDVICASDIWAQHAYVGTKGARRASLGADPGLAGSEALLASLERALDARGCPGPPKRIWITETGVGGPKPGGPRPHDPDALRGQCRAMAAALRSWYDDLRVDAAFQFTFREDDHYPVGLADVNLTRAFPTYDLWRAWGGRSAGDPPPALPAACAG